MDEPIRKTARERWDATQGKDPLFAAIDGSNCPALPQDQRASHSLLIERGLFRIQLPWPAKTWNGKPVEPDFTIEVVRDPNGCNSGPTMGRGGQHLGLSAGAAGGEHEIPAGRGLCLTQTGVALPVTRRRA
jgi:hypothetical protein